MTDFMEQARSLRNTVLWQSNSSVALMASLLRQAYERGLEDAAKVAESIWGGPAHTYASENAELYRMQDRAAERVATAIRQMRETRE